MTRRIRYIYERADWPRFRWSSEAISDQLAAVRHHQGRLLGRIESLGFNLRAETTLQTLTRDAVKTSEIEGELLDPDEVRSSLARRLGKEKGGLRPSDKKADAIAAVVLDATQRFDRPLTAERLFGWHASLFPNESRGRHPIKVGGWRTDEHRQMIVASGHADKETIHFEAPHAQDVPAQMDSFLRWLDDPADNITAYRAVSSGKSSSRNSAGSRAPAVARRFSICRSSTRLILPEIVFGSS